MSQSKNTSRIFGSVEVVQQIELNNTHITGLALPVNASDASNKAYVDSKIVASNLVGGVGITVNTGSNTINSNPSQTQIVALGNIQIGTWAANTIQVPYGGTGQTSFSVNKLIFYNGANKLASTPEITYDTQTLMSSIPIVVSNTRDTTNSLSSVGSLIVNGGVNIHKQLFVNGDATFNSNIFINGSFTLNQINANSAIFSSTSTGSLNGLSIDVTNYLTSPLISSSNLISTNNSQTNLILVRGTCGSCNFANITTGNLNVNNLSIFSTTFASSISCGNLIVSSITSSANIIVANITTGTLRVSTLASVSNAVITSQTSSNMNILVNINTPSINSVSLVNTHGNITNITNLNFITTNTTIPNIVNTSFSGSSIIVSDILTTNLSSANIQGTGRLNIPNATIANIVHTNISTTSIINNTHISTVSSIASLRISGTCNVLNMIGTSSTISNLVVSNNLTSNFHNSSISTIGSININSTMNSNTISVGNLYNNISRFSNSSIGTLNVSGNITNTGGTILTNNITSSNIDVSNLINSVNINTNNLTLGSLLVNGVSIQGTVFSSNLSSGNINVSSIINVPNINNTNSTISNIINTNISTSNISGNNLIITNVTSSNIRTSLSSIGNNFVVNSSIANAIIINSNITTNTSSTLLNTRIFNLQSNYQGSIINSAGSFFNILPSTFTNNVTSSGGSVSEWYANYISSPILNASNSNITTNKVANFYIKSNVTPGPNQSVNFNSGLLLGYVTNSTGGKLNTQISFERSDNNPNAGIYTENTTNRFVFINSSLAGGSGIGLYTVTNTPVVFSNIPNSNNITPVDYIQLLNTTSRFYSTIDSTCITDGSLVLSGGLGVSKTINTSNLISDTSTISNLRQSGYGLFSLLTINYPIGESDIEFTTGNFSSGVSINVEAFTINSSVVNENVITFQYPGIYNVSLNLNSSTTCTSPTLIQTNINKFSAGNWQVYQSSSQKMAFESNTDIQNLFMIQVQENESIKFTLNNGHTSTFSLNNNITKSRLSIHKVG